MKSNRRKPTGGLTILEVLVVLATLCLLALLLIPSLGTSVKAPLTACGSNLKQLTLGEIIWANDHNSTNTLPAFLSTNFGGYRESLFRSGLSYYYQSLSNELVDPRILTCPSDTRKPAKDFASVTTNHLSYFLNMDAKSGAENPTVLHGDRYIVFTPAARQQPVLLTTNFSMAWAKNLGHSSSTSIGNLSFSDGGVTRANNHDLTESLSAPSHTNAYKFFFP